MRKSRTLAVVGISAVLVLSACTTEEEPSDSSSDGGATENITTTTCAAGDRIGVALPQQTSENWTLAKNLFDESLTAAGFVPDVQFADAGTAVASQQSKADNMLTNGAKVLVIGAEDGKQLGTQVSSAEAQGVPVIAYDRPIDSVGTDYYIAYDNFKVGQLQGQALLDGMADLKGESPYNIEIFAGAPTDANAPVFYDGAMDVLQPKIDDGTLVVTSGQTDFNEVATEGWLKSKAQERMDNLITNFYNSGTDLSGVLSPNDSLAEGILNAATAASLTPVVTGQDSEVVAVQRIAAGTQYSTIYKDTRALVEKTVASIEEICTGAVLETDDSFTWPDSGLVLPGIFLEPLIVTKENAAEVYANDPTLLAAFQG